MARSAILSNGRLCVGLDEKGFVNDFYYPYVGLDNVTSARFVHHKLGIWVDDVFTWLDSDDWHTTAGLDDHTMMSRVNYHSDRFGVTLIFRDFVDVSYDFFGRVVIVENHTDAPKNVRLFFSQVFQISDAGRVDTALYCPGPSPYIMSYYSNTTFVVGLRTQDGDSFDQFAVGNYGIEGKAGTYLDAEDGELSGNLVEHGGVDSVIRSSFTVHAKGSYHVDYWVCASDRNYQHATHIHRHLSASGLYHYLSATSTYWKKWLTRSAPQLSNIDVKYQSLVTKSLLTIKAHCDEHGGILASADSSIYNYGRDYYNYVWPRDAYYALSPLLALGYFEETKAFLDMITRVVHPMGYVHHKYLPDSSLGSTWHPRMQNGEPELNIQEDETASVVLLALDYIASQGYQSSFAKKLYKKIIKPCAQFMSEYFDEETGLPHASYDLWEQVFLTNTYTVAITYRALVSAREFANAFEPTTTTDRWTEAIELIEKNFGKLFSMQNQWFVRGLKNDASAYVQDITLDIASLYGPAMYGPVSTDDTAIFATQKAVEEHLVNKGCSGGVIRYPGDGYMLTSNRPGNPWYVCTMWLAQYYQKSTGDTKYIYDALDWTLVHATPSGLLSEQLDPDNGQVRGVSPLVWSHAEYLRTIAHLYKT